MHLRGHRRSGHASQPAPVSRLMQMCGEEACVVIRRVSMAPQRLVIPQYIQQEPYSNNTDVPQTPPVAFGPVRTPSRRPDLNRLRDVEAACSPPLNTGVDPVLYASHKGRIQAA